MPIRKYSWAGLWGPERRMPGRKKGASSEDSRKSWSEMDTELEYFSFHYSQGVDYFKLALWSLEMQTGETSRPCGMLVILLVKKMYSVKKGII